MNKEEIEKIISEYQRKNLGTPEVLACVRKDLEYGISKEQIDGYMKNYDLNSAQKEIYSECLRKNYPKEFIHLMVETIDEEKRKLLVEYFEKGMSVEQMKEVIEKKPETPAALHKMLQTIYAGLTRFTENAYDNEKLVSQFQSQIDTIVKKFESQEEKISQMYQTIEEHKNADYNEEQEQLLKQISDLENDLEREKNARTEQTGTIIKLRNERNGLHDSVEYLKNEIQKRNEELQKEREKVEDLGRQLEEAKKKEADNNQGITPGVSAAKMAEQIQKQEHTPTQGQEPAQTNIPAVTAYAVPGFENTSCVIVREPAKKEKKVPGMALIKKLFWSKGSNRHLMKKVIQSGLNEGQIKQVASGFEKGLTYGQLDILIESKAAPEKMAGIIELAVLENSLEMG